MAIIDHIDGVNRRIYLHADTVGSDLHPMDIYREMRTLRVNNESLQNFKVFLLGFGNVGKTNTTATERYVMCMNGTRIVPYDISHQLKITGTIITDDKQEGVDCFDKVPLSVTTMVDITYAPKQVEVITVNVDGSALTQAEHDTLFDTNVTVNTIPEDVWNHTQ